jgi:hypothetical protein
MSQGRRSRQFANGLLTLSMLACSDGTDPTPPDSPDPPAGPPSFTLTASHSRITTPGQVIFTSESDEVLTRVELYEGETKVGESVGISTPQRVTVNVTSEDNGTHTYTAKGLDDAREVGFSNPVIVEVDIRWDLIRSVDGIRSDGILPLAADATGAVYLGGTTQPSEASPDRDGFLSKYDANGNRLWVQHFSSSEYARTYSVGADPSGRGYLTGYISRQGRQEGDDVECFLLVYSLTGSLVWSAPPQEGVCVAATDASGSFYLARSVFATDIFLTKYDPNGQVLWTRQFGTRPSFPNDDVLTSIVVDPGGGVYVSGYTSGSLDGGPNRGGRDVFVVKFDAVGNNLWGRQFGTTDHDFGSSLAADPEGGVYVAGGKDHPEFRFGRFGDALLARYSSDGTLLWVRHLDGGLFDDAWSVAADQNAVYVVGLTSGAGGSDEFSEVRQGPSDGFLAKLSHDGGLQSVRLLGGPGRDGALGVALGRSGNVYVALSSEGGLPGVPEPSAVLARQGEPTP